MRALTKVVACQELRMCQSTLKWRIAVGDVAVQRGQRGRRHRVYEILNDDTRAKTDHIAETAELADADTHAQFHTVALANSDP